MASQEVNFNILVEEAPDAIVVFRDNRVIFANPAAIRLAGAKNFAELKEVEVVNLIDSKFKQKVLARAKKAMIGETIPIETQLFRNLQGREIFLETVSKRIIFESQPALLVILHDVTERENAQRALQESEERFRVMADGTPCLLWVSDINGNNIFVNNCYKEFFGIDLNKADKQKWRSFLHPEDEPAYVEKVFNALSKRKSFYTQARVRRRDGTWRWLESNAKPRFSAVNEFLGHVGISIDITDRKRAEEKLIKSESLLAQTQHVAAIGSWEWNIETQKVSFSDGLYYLFGIEKSSFKLTLKSFLDIIYPPDRDLVSKSIKETMFECEPVDLEYRILRSGSVRIMHAKSIVSARKDTGAPIEIRGIVEDITERKQLQNKLEEYSHNLEELVKQKTMQLRETERLAAIGQTARMVGHDIRNPLQAIAGDLYLIDTDVASLPENELKKGLQESVNSIQSNLLYIAKIVEDLQDYAKEQKPKLEKIDINRVIEDVMPLVNISSDHQVIIDVEKGFPEIVADFSMLKRAVSNLVVNAVQAMPNGGQLTIKAHYKDNQVFIVVEDTGVGISEKVKSNLFKPMVTTKAKGQGLGLAVVKRLVEAQNGTITFESQEGKGTKFIIQVPLHP